jgi:hypothetical protein
MKYSLRADILHIAFKKKVRLYSGHSYFRNEIRKRQPNVIFNNVFISKWNYNQMDESSGHGYDKMLLGQGYRAPRGAVTDECGAAVV